MELEMSNDSPNEYGHCLFRVVRSFCGWFVPFYLETNRFNLFQCQTELDEWKRRQHFLLEILTKIPLQSQDEEQIHTDVMWVSAQPNAPISKVVRNFSQILRFFDALENVNREIPHLLSGCSLSLAIIWKNVASKIFPQNPQNRNTCHFISDSIKFCGNLFGLQ